MTGSLLAVRFAAEQILLARLELSYLSGPLAAHWAWRAAVWAAGDAPLWERPHAVLDAVRAALAVAELAGPDAGEDWPAWERRGAARSVLRESV